jgi:hypothetical protein
MSEAGACIVREDGVADSTPYVARQLSDDLQRRYGLKPAQQRLEVTDDDAPTAITAAHPSADLVLDVRTTWSLEFLPHDWSKYRLTYTAHLRLIDAKIVHLIDGKKGAVIASGTCSHLTEETSSAPSYDEFLANRAQRLKDEIEVGARFCVEELRSKVLIPPQTAGVLPSTGHDGDSRSASSLDYWNPSRYFLGRLPWRFLVVSGRQREDVRCASGSREDQTGPASPSLYRLACDRRCL